MKILFYGLLGCWCLGSALADEILEKQGNLYWQTAQTAPRQLTRLGLDAQPALSPDGQRVVFVRRQASVNPLNATDAPTELWQVKLDGSQPQRLLAAREDSEPKNNLTDFSQPVFSLDGRSVYFNTAAWVTSGAIHRLDAGQTQPVFITDGDSIDLVDKGKYAGHLIVFKHKYRKNGGANDAYWLVSPQGREVRRIGADEAAVQDFLRRQH